MKKARLICLEGIEGTGKTTHMRWIASYLQSIGQPFILTREPGGTIYAEAIRQLILNPPKTAEPLTSEAELLLLFAARAQHIANTIRPALQKGHWVICDRFTEASYAYQGGGRGLPENFIEYLEQQIHQNLRIDRVFLFNMPVHEALNNMKERNTSLNQNFDRIETESEAFFERIQQAYLARARSKKVPYSVISANRPIEQIQAELATILEQMQ